MSEAVKEYRVITATDEFKYWDMVRERARHDEAQAISNAEKRGERISDEKWQKEVERIREKARHDEAQAISNAEKREREKWQKEVERIREKAHHDEAQAISNAEKREREKWQKEVERIREKARHVEAQAVNNAEKRGERISNEKWQAVVADKDALIAELQAKLLQDN